MAVRAWARSGSDRLKTIAGGEATAFDADILTRCRRVGMLGHPGGSATDVGMTGYESGGRGSLVVLNTYNAPTFLTASVGIGPVPAAT